MRGKKYLIALTILMLTFKFGNSQTNVYYPFPDSNATWNEETFGGVPPNVYYNYYSLFIFNDTIIGNYTYHKLLDYPGYNYIGAFRQDTLQRKVFFMSDTASNEQLLYDFNLDVGDTLPISYNNWNNSGNKISGIDSVLVGNIYHKRYYLAPFYGSYLSPDYAIIEGVGSTLGLLQPIFSCIEACSELLCFEQNGQSYPPNYSCAVRIAEINKQKFEIEIYPNPFSSQTTLHTDKLLKNAALYVYSPFGQQVKQIKNISIQTITLDRDNLSSGLYFIRLTQDNKTLATDKLIITD